MRVQPEAMGPDRSYLGARALVLGASGFIGSWVARSLCTKGAKVFLVVRDKRIGALKFLKYGVRGKILEADLGDPGAVRNLILRLKPSITFNLAGYGVDPSEREEETAYQINAYLVKTIAEAVAEGYDPGWDGQNIIHTGSALEYGEIGGDLEEGSIPNPTTLYGQSKLAGTDFLISICKEARIKGLIARLFTVYGPGEHSARLLPSLLQAARSGSTLSLTSGTQKRDFTYVADVAEGLLRLGLANSNPGEIINLGTGRLTSVRSFVETTASILHISANRLQFGAITTRWQEMEHEPVSIERLKKLIAWTPPTQIDEGIQKTIHFEGNHVSGG